MATAGKILMFPVGNWTSGNNYGFLDIVYFGGSSYIAKTDITNSTVDPATDTTNWQILARGYLADTLSGIDGIDTSGLIGTAGATVSSQTLIDKIADMVADKLVLKTAISNQQVNDTTKVPSSALAYLMDQDITTLNSNLTNKSISFTALTGFEDSTTYIRRYGNIVVAAIGVRTTASVTQNVVNMMQISSGFPVVSMVNSVSGVYGGNETYASARLRVDNTGVISVFPSVALSSNMFIQGEIIWITE